MNGQDTIMQISRRLGAVFICLLALFSSGSFAALGSCPDNSAYPLSGCSVDGVNPSGFPYFDQLVNVQYAERSARNDGFNLNANFYQGSFRSHLYVTPEDMFDISKTKYSLKAKVIDGVASGTISIRGRIDELGITPKKKKKKKSPLLMKADLSGEWGISDDGTLIGFNTENIVCNDAINAYLGGGGCTENESLYLSLLESVLTGEKNIKTVGVSVATVPLPAAAWLFGSGLLGLIGLARRKKTT
jgi:hypothetical protein